ncbi:hypothetical protein TNIN_239521 [Trichonephila inaurata madagascariensis]|uniref:Uncharacterized protein n=1 Tax=Trichonephila inaurata madagascariensis TaxID=2747483 RepID=A0A8X6YSE0_9ARAC|nr:hypothetical protein TNIN_239521 [Trichonephila inaurata madagascariensis]
MLHPSPRQISSCFNGRSQHAPSITAHRLSIVENGKNVVRVPGFLNHIKTSASRVVICLASNRSVRVQHGSPAALPDSNKFRQDQSKRKVMMEVNFLIIKKLCIQNFS